MNNKYIFFLHYIFDGNMGHDSLFFLKEYSTLQKYLIKFNHKIIKLFKRHCKNHQCCDDCYNSIEYSPVNQNDVIFQ